jgi:hypothetical protein
VVQYLGKVLNRRYTALEEYVADAPPAVVDELRRLEHDLQEALEDARREGARRTLRRF